MNEKVKLKSDKKEQKTKVNIIWGFCSFLMSEIKLYNETKKFYVNLVKKIDKHKYL